MNGSRIALAAAVSAALALGSRLLPPAGLSGVVNAPLRSIDSPVAGTVETPLPAPGARLPAGRELLLRAERSAAGGAADLQRRLAELDAERLRLASEIALHQRMQRHRQAPAAAAGEDRLPERLRQARAQIPEREVAAARAWLALQRVRQDENAGPRERAAAEEQLRRSDQDLRAARARLGALEFAYGSPALAAARESGPTGPLADGAGRSAERERRLAEALQQQQALQARRRKLASDLEWLQSAQPANAPLRIPLAAGRLWRRSGSRRVAAGEELAAIALCSRLLVTAELAWYRALSLRPGRPVKVLIDRAQAGRRQLNGRIARIDTAGDGDLELALPFDGGAGRRLLVELGEPVPAHCDIGARARLEF